MCHLTLTTITITRPPAPHFITLMRNVKVVHHSMHLPQQQLTRNHLKYIIFIHLYQA